MDKITPKPPEPEKKEEKPDSPPQPEKREETPTEPPKEIGGPEGPEPTRYGDWAIGGRVSDF